MLDGLRQRYPLVHIWKTEYEVRVRVEVGLQSRRRAFLITGLLVSSTNNASLRGVRVS